MPFKLDKIKLTEKYDRRIKLTKHDKKEIREQYATGNFSLNDLAKIYEVSKKTILLTVNKESKEKNDLRIKENWKKYQKSKEKRTEAMRNTRNYKRKLYFENKIGQDI